MPLNKSNKGFNFLVGKPQDMKRGKYLDNENSTTRDEIKLVSAEILFNSRHTTQSGEANRNDGNAQPTYSMYWMNKIKQTFIYHHHFFLIKLKSRISRNKDICRINGKNTTIFSLCEAKKFVN